MRGFGLVELMVAFSIMSVVGLIGGKLVQRMYDGTRQNEVLFERNGAVQFSNLRLASEPLQVAIKAIQKGCESLKTCLLADSTQRPTRCSSQPVSCSFFDGSKEFAGSETKPVVLGLTGERCSSLSAKCPFTIIGYWRYLAHLDSIEFWVDVVHQPQYASKSFGILRPYRGQVDGSVILSLAEIDTWAGCHAGERLAGTSRGGQPICRPLVETVLPGNNQSVSTEENVTIFNLGQDPTGMTLSDYHQIRSDEIANALSSNHLVCPFNYILAGITPTGGPICIALPYTWRYNNTYFHMVPFNGSQPADLLTECPPNPDTKVCPVPGEFCYRRVGTVGIPALQSSGGNLQAQITYRELTQDFPQTFRMNGDQCGPGNPVESSDFVFDTVSLARTPETSLWIYRVMRCVPL